jgi:hypothetical protein
MRNMRHDASMSDSANGHGTSTPLESAPRQGYEADVDDTSGSVHPPAATELAVSAAELVGDLAKVGFSASERLVRGALSRLPRP